MSASPRPHISFYSKVSQLAAKNTVQNRLDMQRVISTFIHTRIRGNLDVSKELDGGKRYLERIEEMPNFHRFATAQA